MVRKPYVELYLTSLDTFPSSSVNTTWTSFYASTARSSFLVNSPDLAFRIQTTVKLSPFSKNSSPATSGLAIVTLIKGGITTHTIPSSDSDGDVVRYRLSTGTEQGTSNSNLVPNISNPNFTTHISQLLIL
jgi:hypothetical protein